MANTFGDNKLCVNIWLRVLGDDLLYSSRFVYSARAFDVGTVVVILFTYACVLGEREKNSSDSVRSCPDIYKYR